ncbi:MAG: biotin-dependent carboxyltransferase family protein [Alphaproteobacteria bacterium]|nr:biotin-dependent carboxyltransferase family protein [Alphaproteobacteria bacterium]
MSPHLAAIAAGPMSTVQDLGRRGYQRFGVSVAGALDPLRLAVANALVGNPPDMAGIEITLAGDRYRIEADNCLLALAGDFDLAIDGRPAAPWRGHRLERGQVFAVGAARAGARGYVAVAGGLGFAPMLGSLSCHVRNRLGPPRLLAGAVLPLSRDRAPKGPAQAIDPSAIAAGEGPLRVVLGPQDDYFTAAGIETFLAVEYRVSRAADRMGYRLEGPRIEHAKGYNIVSDPIPAGAIQVPGAGTPIVLLADRQTTGGYPKIGIVIAPDQGRLAQMKPGDAVRFAAIGRAEAAEAHRAWRARIAALPGMLRPAVEDATKLLDSARLLSLNLIDGAVAEDRA